jgi:hypothetical protein
MNNVPVHDHDKDIQLNALIQQMAQQHQPELPSAGVIWWRAQILRKMEEKKRIERPIVFMRLLAGTISLAVVVYLALSYRADFLSGTAISAVLLAIGLLSFSSLVIYLVASLREARS